MERIGKENVLVIDIIECKLQHFFIHYTNTPLNLPFTTPSTKLHKNTIER